MAKYWISLHDCPEFFSMDVIADSFEEAVKKGIYENTNELLESYDEDESGESTIIVAKEEYEYPKFNLEGYLTSEMNDDIHEIEDERLLQRYETALYGCRFRDFREGFKGKRDEFDIERRKIRKKESVVESKIEEAINKIVKEELGIDTKLAKLSNKKSFDVYVNIDKETITLNERTNK